MEPTVTATPESAHFPEDPLMILRSGWPFLVVYYLAATIIVIIIWRSVRASRFLHARKQRAITAALLAAVYTPSEVSDLFLFNLPGPAVAGLGILLIGIAIIIASQPTALFSPALWGVVAGYYLLPLGIVFVIVYGALSLYAQSHPAATVNA